MAAVIKDLPPNLQTMENGISMQGATYDEINAKAAELQGSGLGAVRIVLKGKGVAGWDVGFEATGANDPAGAFKVTAQNVDFAPVPPDNVYEMVELWQPMAQMTPH